MNRKKWFTFYTIGLCAWDRVAEGVLASGIDKLILERLDLYLILLWNMLVNNRLVVVGNGGSIRVVQTIR